MNISSTLLLTIGLSAFSLFAGILAASFIIIMRNRSKIRKSTRLNEN